MLQVYFSHVGETPLVGVTEPEFVTPGKVRDILSDIESRHPGFCKEILDASGTGLNSATLMFKRIDVDSEGRFLESTYTRPIRDLNETISSEDENLFIALFHPERVMAFLLDTLTESEQRFLYPGGSKKYGAYINASDKKDVGDQPLFASAEPEPLYPFTNGHPMSELVTNPHAPAGHHHA